LDPDLVSVNNRYILNKFWLEFTYFSLFFFPQAGLKVPLAAREEMAALYLLTNLTAPAARLWALAQPAALRAQPRLATALQLAACAADNNYLRFTRLLNDGSRLPPPYRLAASRTSNLLAVCCLRIMSAAYSSPACRYPVAHLAGLLRINPSSLEQYCQHTCGITILDVGTPSACIQFSRSNVKSIPADGLPAESFDFGVELSGEEWRNFVLGLSCQ
jgi:hypothetical protein